MLVRRAGGVHDEHGDLADSETRLRREHAFALGEVAGVPAQAGGVDEVTQGPAELGLLLEDVAGRAGLGDDGAFAAEQRIQRLDFPALGLPNRLTRAFTP